METPSFLEGEPFIVSVFDDINETLDFYWNTLNRETKVAVLAKYIHVENGKVTINCINKRSYNGITQSNYRKKSTIKCCRLFICFCDSLS